MFKTFACAMLAALTTAEADVAWESMGHFKLSHAAFPTISQYKDSEKFLLCSSFKAIGDGGIYVVPEITALEACSIILDCRYVVVAEEVASRVFVSMAQMAELAPSSRDICRRKSVVNKMRSFTVDPENFGEHEDYALWQRHFFFQDLLWRTGAFPEDTEVEACLRNEMHEYIKASSVPWSFCFRNTKLKEGSKDLKNAAQVAGKGAESDQDKKGGQHRQDPGPDSTCAKELQSFEASIREAPAPRYYHEAGWPRAHGQFTAPVPHRGRGAPAPWAAANQPLWSVAPWVGYDSLGEAPWGCYAPIPSHNTFWPSTWQDY